MLQLKIFRVNHYTIEDTHRGRMLKFHDLFQKHPKLSIFSRDIEETNLAVVFDIDGRRSILGGMASHQT